MLYLEITICDFKLGRFWILGTPYLILNFWLTAAMVSPHAKNRTGHGAGLTPSRHSAGQSKVKPLLERVGNWRDFLLGGVSEEEIERIGRHERTGGPLGNDGFVGKFDHILQRRKPGRKRGGISANKYGDPAN